MWVVLFYPFSPNVKCGRICHCRDLSKIASWQGGVTHVTVLSSQRSWNTGTKKAAAEAERQAISRKNKGGVVASAQCITLFLISACSCGKPLGVNDFEIKMLFWRVNAKNTKWFILQTMSYWKTVRNKLGPASNRTLLVFEQSFSLTGEERRKEKEIVYQPSEAEAAV